MRERSLAGTLVVHLAALRETTSDYLTVSGKEPPRVAQRVAKMEIAKVLQKAEQRGYRMAGMTETLMVQKLDWLDYWLAGKKVEQRAS